MLINNCYYSIFYMLLPREKVYYEMFLFTTVCVGYADSKWAHLNRSLIIQKLPNAFLVVGVLACWCGGQWFNILWWRFLISVIVALRSKKRPRWLHLDNWTNRWHVERIWSSDQHRWSWVCPYWESVGGWDCSRGASTSSQRRMSVLFHNTQGCEFCCLVNRCLDT